MYHLTSYYILYILYILYLGASSTSSPSFTTLLYYSTALLTYYYTSVRRELYFVTELYDTDLRALIKTDQVLSEEHIRFFMQLAGSDFGRQT